MATSSTNQNVTASHRDGPERRRATPRASRCGDRPSPARPAATTPASARWTSGPHREPEDARSESSARSGVPCARSPTRRSDRRWPCASRRPRRSIHQIAPNSSTAATAAGTCRTPPTSAPTGGRVRSHAAEAPASDGAARPRPEPAPAPPTAPASTPSFRARAAGPRRVASQTASPASSQAATIARRRIIWPPPSRCEATVTAIGVVDAETPGTYIGVTCAGIARNVPGVTIFSRYQNSTRPPGRPSWKNTARSSRNSWRPPHGRLRRFSSGYRLSSAMVSAPAGSGILDRGDSASRRRRPRSAAPARRRQAPPCRKTASRDRRCGSARCAR